MQVECYMPNMQVDLHSCCLKHYSNLIEARWARDETFSSLSQEVCNQDLQAPSGGY